MSSIIMLLSCDCLAYEGVSYTHGCLLVDAVAALWAGPGQRVAAAHGYYLQTGLDSMTGPCYSIKTYTFREEI